MGNPEGKFPQCQMVLDCNDSIMVVSPVGLVRGRSWDTRVVSNYMAQTPVRFPRPFHLEIKPKDLIRRGFHVVFKNSAGIKVPCFDEKYFVTTDHMKFVRQILPGSPLVELLLKTKYYRITIEPVADERSYHTLQVICLIDLNPNDLLGQTVEPGDISMLVDLCRSASETFKRYPMEP